MFCIACASPNPISLRQCRNCGAPLPARRGEEGESRGRAFRRRAVGGLPLLALLCMVGLLFGREVQQRQSRAAVYERADVALTNGDYLAALDGFAEAGGYRDAEARRVEVDALLAPYRAAFDTAKADLAAGRYDRAVETLDGIVTVLPNHEEAQALLVDARGLRIDALLAEADEAERMRHWLTAEHALAAVAAERPGDQALAGRLAALREEHSPLLYTREGDIYTGGPDLQDEHLIASDIDASWPAWSPDRTQVAFVSYPSESNEIYGDLYTVNVDGTALRKVATSILAFGWPVWSPDGTKIGFVSAEHFDRRTGAGYIGINVVDLATGAVTDVTGNRFSFATALSWSPDSTRIAFINRTIIPTGSNYFDVQGGDLQIIDLRTGAIENVTGARIEHEWWASWSPTADRVVVLTNPGDWTTDEANRIYLVDLPTGSIELIPTEAWRTGNPYWSPDGERFAFVEGENTIRVWSERGIEWLQVPTDIAVQLSWSPDGSRLLAPSADPREPSYIVPITEHFGHRAALSLNFDNAGGPYGPPQWSPRAAVTVPASAGDENASGS